MIGSLAETLGDCFSCVAFVGGALGLDRANSGVKRVSFGARSFLLFVLDFSPDRCPPTSQLALRLNSKHFVLLFGASHCANGFESVLVDQFSLASLPISSALDGLRVVPRPLQNYRMSCLGVALYDLSPYFAPLPKNLSFLAPLPRLFALLALAQRLLLQLDLTECQFVDRCDELVRVLRAFREVGRGWSRGFSAYRFSLAFGDAVE